MIASLDVRRLAHGAAGVMLLCALIAGGTPADAQSRFVAVSHETVAAIPGLQVVTLRDAVVNACYTVFILEPSRPLAPAASTSIEAATGERDRQLAELTADFERALVGAVPGTLGPTPLRYQWEGDKIQTEYERQLRGAEADRLEARLAEIASTPRLAVAGPAPCGPPPVSPSRSER